MRLDDGRVLPNFMGQALRGEPLTIYGDGSQTRSFCYVDDLVEGIYRLLQTDSIDDERRARPSFASTTNAGGVNVECNHVDARRMQQPNRDLPDETAADQGDPLSDACVREVDGVKRN